jgi:hypothetical protein
MDAIVTLKDDHPDTGTVVTVGADADDCWYHEPITTSPATIGATDKTGGFELMPEVIP